MRAREIESETGRISFGRTFVEFVLEKSVFVLSLEKMFLCLLSSNVLLVSAMKHYTTTR